MMFPLFAQGAAMKVMWCWRCQVEVPMLDEEEFAAIEKLYSEGMKSAKAFCARNNLPLSECSIDEHFRSMQDAYEQMTGTL
jgi:hypothetical protein